jgi:hypothetical protein
MNFTTRFFIYAPFALFVALMLGLSIRWFSEADAYSKRLDTLNGHALMPGVTMHFSAKRIGGFPFRLDAVFKDFEIDVATPHGPSSWRAEDFALHRLTYGADKTLFEVAGRQVLRWTGEDGQTHALSFIVGSLQASSIEGDDGLDRFDLVGNAFDSPPLRVAHAEIHARRDPSADAIDLSIAIDGAALAPSLKMSLEPTIKHLLLVAEISPGASMASLRIGRADWPSAVAAVRQAQGRLSVDRLEIDVVNLAATGAGALALDRSARPQGALDLKLTRVDKFMTATRAAPPAKGVAKALLDRATAAGADQSGRLGIVVGAKDGIVYVGSEPVGMLGPVY